MESSSESSSEPSSWETSSSSSTELQLPLPLAPQAQLLPLLLLLLPPPLRPRQQLPLPLRLPSWALRCTAPGDGRGARGDWGRSRRMGSRASRSRRRGTSGCSLNGYNVHSGLIQHSYAFIDMFL
jgi:hypothetical protein